VLNPLLDWKQEQHGYLKIINRIERHLEGPWFHIELHIS